MQPAEAAGRELARQLRQLREQHWPDRRVTQAEVAEALGGKKKLSESLISSWESTRAPVPPPEHRLHAFVTLFAQERPADGGALRVPDERALTEAQRAWRGAHFDELNQLRSAAQTGQPDKTVRIPLAGPVDSIGGGSWHFSDQRPVTVVCAKLPAKMLEGVTYADADDPDYVRSYTYADLDSIIEIFGHLRAVNPASEVTIRTADDLKEDHYTNHLVLLGGLDWNPVTRDLARRLDLPIRLPRRKDGAGYEVSYEVADGKARDFHPVLEETERGPTLREDVGHFFRGVNPYNKLRSITICNGMFGRGTYGVVRALTDAKFRDRNEQYLAQRFGGAESFSILARVLIVNGEAVTPDWTVPDNRLHEWPAAR